MLWPRQQEVVYLVIKLQKIASWASQSGQIIKALCGEKSVYFERFSSVLKEQDFYYVHSSNYIYLGVVLGCVKAVYEDFRKGLLQSIKGLLRAEIFEDFLEMAEYLLNGGYKDAAAVIIGAVLFWKIRLEK